MAELLQAVCEPAAGTKSAMSVVLRSVSAKADFGEILLFSPCSPLLRIMRIPGHRKELRASSEAVTLA